MIWSDGPRPIELAVPCSGSTHHLRWEAGVVTPLDHPDVDAERALAAFGGDPPQCLEHLDLWNEAVADGGFLGEWVDEDLDAARISWLTSALERMRAESWHEFLRDLPMARAGRMGRFVTTFPAPWIDRAALATAVLLVDGDHVVCTRARHLMVPATARRLRRAFVLSAGGRQLAIGSAALVPFDPQIVPGGTPFAEGVLDGRSSWATIQVSERWLFEVWGAGASVIDGRLVLAIDYENAPEPVATVLHWEPDSKSRRRFTATVRTTTVHCSNHAWQLEDPTNLLHSNARPSDFR